MSGRRAAWPMVLVAMVVGLSFGASTASARNTSTKTAQAAAGNALAETLLKEAGKGILSKGAGAGLSFALTAMGIGGEADTAAALAEIKAQLVRVNEQLTTLREEAAAIRNDVLTSDYNNAAREAAPIINNINHAEGLLLDAAKEPSASATQQALAKRASTYIENNLLDKASLLNTLAFGSGPANPTSIYGAAVKVRTADNFLTHDDSVQLRYLVDFYAGYIAAATQLTITYELTQPNYSTSRLTSILNDATSKVERALASRRDAVPQNTVIDARSNLMYWTKFYGVTTHPKLIETDFFASLFFTGVKGQSGMDGWRMPTKDEMVGLIKGWNGSPGQWLMTNGGFATTEGVGDNPAFWTGTGSESPLVIGGVKQWTYWYVRMSDGLVDTLNTGHNQRHGYMAVRTPAEKYVPS